MPHDHSRSDSAALQEIAGLWERTSAGGRAYRAAACCARRRIGAGASPPVRAPRHR